MKGVVCGIIVLMVGASVVSAFHGNPSINSKSMDRGNWLYVGGSRPGNYTRILTMEHNLDLKKVIFIGDDWRDSGAGLSAECETILAGKEKNLLQIVNSLP